MAKVKRDQQRSAPRAKVARGSKRGADLGAAKALSQGSVKRTSKAVKPDAKTAKPFSKAGSAKKATSKDVPLKKPTAPARSTIKPPLSTKSEMGKSAKISKSSAQRAAPAPQSLLSPARKLSGVKQPLAARPEAKVVEKASAPAGTSKSMSKKPPVSIASVSLPAGYRPVEAEPFMNPRQRVYFRNKLLQWKDDIIKQNRETLQVLHDDTLQHSDIADRANSETDRALELRSRDRQRKLISKIDAAVGRIEDGSYGYCEETGEPISLKRLDARPIATLSLEAQERHERREKVYRED